MSWPAIEATDERKLQAIEALGPVAQLVVHHCGTDAAVVVPGYRVLCAKHGCGQPCGVCAHELHLWMVDQR